MFSFCAARLLEECKKNIQGLAREKIFAMLKQQADCTVARAQTLFKVDFPFELGKENHNTRYSYTHCIAL